MTIAGKRALPGLVAALVCMALPASAREPVPLTLDAHIDIGTDFDRDRAPATAEGSTPSDPAKIDEGARLRTADGKP